MSKKPLIFMLFTIGFIFSVAALTLSFGGAFVTLQLGWLESLGLLALNIVGAVLGLAAIKIEINDYYVGKFVCWWVTILLFLLAVGAFLGPVVLGIYAYFATSMTLLQLFVGLIAWIQGGIIGAVLNQLSSR